MCAAFCKHLSVVTLILVLAGCLGLLAALDAGALVVFLLPQVGQDASLGAGALEALESSIQRLVLFDVNFRHSIFPSLRMRRNPLGDQTFCFNSGIIIVKFTIVKSGILFTFTNPYDTIIIRNKTEVNADAGSSRGAGAPLYRN